MGSVINATKRPKPQDQCYHKTKIKEGPFFFTTTTYGCVFAIVFGVKIQMLIKHVNVKFFQSVMVHLPGYLAIRTSCSVPSSWHIHPGGGPFKQY